MTTVAKIISYHQKALLLEWEHNGALLRGTVQIADYPDAERGQFIELSDKELLDVIPYGFPWEEVISITIKIEPEHIANEFRKAGIWTEQDFINNKPLVRTILQRLLGMEVPKLLATIKSMEEPNE